MKTQLTRKQQEAIAAQKLVDKIDSFINSIVDANCLYASLIAKRLLMQCDDDDINSILFELECRAGYKAIKIPTMNAEIAFEQFQEKVISDPHQHILFS